jgi:hypothetical protein
MEKAETKEERRERRKHLKEAMKVFRDQRDADKNDPEFKKHSRYVVINGVRRRRDHFVFPDVYKLATLHFKGYDGEMTCMDREGALLFCGGGNGVLVWNLVTGQLVHHILQTETRRERRDRTGIDADDAGVSACEAKQSSQPGREVVTALSVVGGVLFVALESVDQHSERKDGEINPRGRIIAVDWAADRVLYALYDGDAIPTCINVRLPVRTKAVKSGQKVTTLIAGFKKNGTEQGEVKVYRFRMI